MSTERREVDMKSASDQQGQPRIVPTRPGWWLIKADPLHSPDKIQHGVVRIRQGSGGLLIVGTSPNRVDQRPDIVWIAEIPGPAVLTALAEYREALAGLDDSTRLPSDVLGVGNRVTVGQAIQDFDLSKARLTDAIRAERDAEREGSDHA